jgi:small subunit ribosomal protein S6
MKQRYEALLILNVKGNEESAREIIERLEGEFKTDGAELEQVQKIGNRHFSYVAGESDSGFYVNFVFHSAPTVIERLKSRFKLSPDIYRQYYQKLTAARREPAKAAA